MRISDWSSDVCSSDLIRWNYGHCTIPRHLRDTCIDEYGIADLRGKNDEDCVIAMAGITEARHQQALVDTAKRDRKLRADFLIPSTWSRNTPGRLRATLAPFRADGTLPDYPQTGRAACRGRGCRYV